MAAGALLGVLLLTGVLAACGSPEESQATPGYDDKDKVPDTSPFEIAQSDDQDRETTIPNGVFDSTTTIPQASTSTTAAPITVPPSEVTTTTAPGPLVPPKIAAITDICGLEQNLAPFQYLTTKSPSEVEGLMTDLVQTTEKYAQVVPAENQSVARELARAFVALRTLLADNGWDTKSEAFTKEVQVYQVQAVNNEPGSLPVLLTSLVQVEKVLCR